MARPGVCRAAVLTQRLGLERHGELLAEWCSGVCFGLLHAANALVGVSPAFVALQALNATIWGVMYGYARARTESTYPPILLHAAKNLVVVLF